MAQSTISVFGVAWRVVTTLCACMLFPTVAAAHPYTIDQMQPNLGPGPVFLLSNDIGQTFTPTLGSLEVVELWLMDTQPFDGATDTLSVRIFGMDGALLGASAPQNFADLYGGGTVALTHFDFAPITLVPGTKYAIGFDVSSTGAFPNLAALGYNLGTYTGGGVWRWSTQSESQTADLVFVEGPAAAGVPEPASTLVFGVALLGYAARRQFTRQS